MVLNMKETSFPRYGNTEKSRAKSEVEPGKRKRMKSDLPNFSKDDLFTTASVNRKLFDKKKKEKHLKYLERKKNLTKVDVVSFAAQKVDSLKIQDVSTDMLVLCSVHEINDYGIKVMLPGGLKAKASVVDISDPYTARLKEYTKKGENDSSEIIPTLSSMFAIGRLFCCKVTTVEGKQISVTLNPREVNNSIASSNIYNNMILNGAVKSIEDHGYCIDIGIPNVEAFLPHKNAINFTNKRNNENLLVVGQVLQCIVTKANSRVITVSLELNFKSKKQHKDVVGISLLSTLPGTFVEANVTKIIKNGILLKINEFNGLVHELHLKTPFENLNEYHAGSMVFGKVLYINQLSKLIYVTLQNQFVKPYSKEQETFPDIRVGSVIEKAKIMKVGSNYVCLKLDKGVRACAFGKHAMKNGEEDSLDSYEINTLHKCKVLSLNIFDEIVHVSLKESVIQTKKLTLDQLHYGDKVMGKVVEINSQGVLAKIENSLQGIIPMLHTADFPLKQPEKKFKIGNKLQCRVLDLNPVKHYLKLTCKESLVQSRLPIINSTECLKKNLVTEGFIVSINFHGVLVAFYGNFKGFARRSELGLASYKNPQDAFYIGQVVKCRVLRWLIQQDKLQIHLSLNVQEDCDHESPKQIYGKLLACSIREISSERLSVCLSNNVEAFIPILHLSDDPEECENLFKNYKVGDVISQVTIVSHRKENIVTAKSSFINWYKNNSNLQSYNEIEKSMVVPGCVVNVTSKGSKVLLPGGLYGFVPQESYLSTMSEKKLTANQSLLLKVIDVNAEAKKVSLKVVSEKNTNSDELPITLKRKNEFADDKELYENDKNLNISKRKKGKNIDKIESLQGNFAPKESKLVKLKNSVPRIDLGNIERLDVQEGFIWDFNKKDVNTFSNIQNNFNMSDDEDFKENELHEEIENEVQVKPSKKKKSNKFEEEKAEENELYKTEKMLADTERAPQNVDDFDRLALASPNSSLIWMQFMAFHLQSAEIEKARAVADRALKTISFREEKEKLNVWAALLNLENLYGTKESLSEVFQKALQFNEPINVFNHLVNIYIGSEKLEEAKDLYKTMVKRFSTNKDVWLNFGLFYLKTQQFDAAHHLLQRGLKCLDKTLHVDVISKFAQLEFKYGDPERGKTMFESVLTNYPKRTDVWSIYKDMLLKTKNIDAVRQLYERVLTVNLSVKKMKIMFKKFMEFEEKFGTPERVNYLKQKAIEYVESKGYVDE